MNLDNIHIKLCRNLMLLSVVLVILLIATRDLKYIYIFFLIHHKYAVFLFVFLFCIIFAFIFKLPKIYRLGTRFLYRYGFNLKHNFHKLPDKPCIICSNYNSKPNIVDFAANSLFPVKTVLIINNPYLEILVSRFYEKDRYIRMEKEQNNFGTLKNKIKKFIDNGYYVFVYVERHVQRNNYLNNVSIQHDVNKTTFSITDLRKGMFKIAHELRVPIIPVVISSIPFEYPFTTNINYEILLGDVQYVDDVEKTMKDVLCFMKKNLRRMKLHNI